MMKSLFLSHWEEGQEVCLQLGLVNNLKSQHVLGVRFLYNCYRKKHNGAVLNYDAGMNYPLIVQAFLNAVFQLENVNTPVLVLSPESDMCTWHYHLKQIGPEVLIVNEKNCEEVFKKSEPLIILSSLKHLTIIHPFRDNSFSFVIVAQFDSVASKMIFKKLNGSFNIALTNQDFMVDRDQKLLWTILDWTNPKLFGKLADFYEMDRNHLNNFRDPYDQVWHRLRWDYCESFVKDSEEEQEAYEETLKNWCKLNKLKFTNHPQQDLRKRKLHKLGETDKKKRKQYDGKTEKTGSVFRLKVEGNIVSRKFHVSKFHYEETVEEDSNHKKCVSEVSKVKKHIITDEQNNIVGVGNNKILMEKIAKNPTSNVSEAVTEVLNGLFVNNGLNTVTNSDMYLAENWHKNLQVKEKEVLIENVKSTEIDDNPILTAIMNGSQLNDAISSCFDSTNALTSNSQEDESGTLFSIMEGKFSLTQTSKDNTLEKLTQETIELSPLCALLHYEGIESDGEKQKEEGVNCNEGNVNASKELTEFDSKNMLMSLYGDEAEYIEEDTEEIRSLKDRQRLISAPDKVAVMKIESSIYSERENKLSSHSEGSGCFNEVSSNETRANKSWSTNNLLNTLFEDDDDVKSYIKTRDERSKLSDSKRNALISSLFGD